jgi:hypothetical protein
LVQRPRDGRAPQIVRGQLPDPCHYPHVFECAKLLE